MPFSSILRLVVAGSLLIIGLILAFYFVMALLVIGGLLWLYLFIRSRFMRSSFPESRSEYATIFEQMVVKETLNNPPIIEGQFETVETKDSLQANSQKK